MKRTDEEKIALIDVMVKRAKETSDWGLNEHLWSKEEYDLQIAAIQKAREQFIQHYIEENNRFVWKTVARCFIPTVIENREDFRRERQNENKN